MNNFVGFQVASVATGKILYTAAPTGYADAQRIEIPVKSMAAMSSMHVGLLAFLHAEEVLTGLEKDHDYLLAGGVFTQDLIDTWIDYKRSAEISPIALRPTPHEFALYFDV